MIGYLRGQVVHDDSEKVIVEVAGVGYELYCSQNTLDDFFANADIKAWVYTHVREDALMLYGFSTQLEKQVFESLLKVNGVGPKMAIKILSGAPLAQLTEMIESADTTALAKIPKVGKKTAEQIVLSLKGKIQPLEVAREGVGSGPMGARKQIISALVNLGFKAADVEKVLGTLPADIEFEKGLRQGLAALTQS